MAAASTESEVVVPIGSHHDSSTVHWNNEPGGADPQVCPTSDRFMDRSLIARELPSRRRDLLYAHLTGAPVPGINQEEVDAHFQGMPARYWEQVGEAQLLWDLQTVHAFLAKLNDPDSADTPVAVDWRREPESGLTKALVCTWDRHGLLAKIAAAFGAMRANIIRADVYTRADNVVLDSFEVCDLDCAPMADRTRLQAAAFLIEGALCEPPRFASVWAAQAHKVRPHPHQMTPRVHTNNHSSPEYTVLRVEASDRRGLLYDVLQAFADCGVNVAQAIVNTVDGVALDVFYLVDLEGRKILSPPQIRRIRRAVPRAIVS